MLVRRLGKQEFQKNKRFSESLTWYNLFGSKYQSKCGMLRNDFTCKNLFYRWNHTCVQWVCTKISTVCAL